MKPGKRLSLRDLARIVYWRLPLKRQLFCGLRRLWTPPERIFRHLSFEGPFSTTFAGRSFRLFHAGTWIENTLFWEGMGKSWERVSLRVWARLALRAEVVLDIGANTGVYSALASAMNPRARVFAFEPNPEFYRAIQRCNELNGFDIRLHPVALSDVTGTIAFSGYEVERVAPEGSLPGSWVTVPVTTLAQVIESENLAKVDLVKCDVERHEPQVFKGMGTRLSEFRPDILVEVLDDECAARLEEIFRPLAYRYYSIDDRRGTIQPIPGIRKSNHWNVLACRAETAAGLEADTSLPWLCDSREARVE